MSGAWMNVALGVAMIVLVANALRLLPAAREGQAALKSVSIRWVMLFLVAWLLAQLAVGLVIGLIVSFTLFGPVSQQELESVLKTRLSELIMIAQVVGLLSVLAAAYFGQRVLRRQSFWNLGLRWYRGCYWDVAIGLAVGVGSGALMLGAYALSGQATIAQGQVGGALATTLVSALAFFLLVSFSEEILVRGFLLQTVEAGWGSGAGAVVSALFWGGLHIFNYGVTFWALVTVAAAGLVYALGYLATRSLWLPIALHFAWNFAEGPLFGFRVSGVSTNGVLSTTLDGAEHVTGGAFGPEAGLVYILVLAAQVGVLWWWARARRRFTGTVQPVAE